MPRAKGEEGKKNIKNIYVHKINSLMMLSRDNLCDSEMEIMMGKPDKE